MKAPRIWWVQDLIKHCYAAQVFINGKEVPWRHVGPENWIRYRLKATWLVFTGKADAVRWPEGQ
jgi:hypothetical protein